MQEVLHNHFEDDIARLFSPKNSMLKLEIPPVQVSGMKRQAIKAAERFSSGRGASERGIMYSLRKKSDSGIVIAGR